MPDLSQPFELGFAFKTIGFILVVWVVGAVLVRLKRVS
jgi:hypothetical protein